MSAGPPFPPAGNRPPVDPEEILAGIRAWVEIETPTSDAAAVTRLAHKVAEELEQAGAVVERRRSPMGFGDLVTARTPWGDGPGIVVLCHLDTVHPVGTLERLPFRREGDRVYGPGTYDMKGGAYLASYVMRRLLRTGEPTALPVTLMFMPDEEVGSVGSRRMIETMTRAAKYVLVVEPARDGGKVVTARKGAARFTLSAHGRPAHSGSRHADGRSAIREIARHVLEVEGWTDYDRGVTVNVGRIEGGTTGNTVPERASCLVDIRLPDQAAVEEMCARVAALRSYDPDVRLSVSGGVNRPPFARSPAIAALLETAQSAARELGIDLADTATGGGSDGNFPAAMGVPVLDGLGVDGDGAHTQNEYLLYSSLAPRAALLERLIERLR